MKKPAIAAAVAAAARVIEWCAAVWSDATYSARIERDLELVGTEELAREISRRFEQTFIVSSERVPGSDARKLRIFWNDLHDAPVFLQDLALKMWERERVERKNKEHQP